MEPSFVPSRALWLNAKTIAWPENLSGIEARYSLVGHPNVKIWAGSLSPEHSDLDWRTKHDRYIALNLVDASGGPLDREVVKEILKGPLKVQASHRGEVLAETGIQIGSVLDDLYANAVPEGLGIVWDGPNPSLRVWAPTARHVSLRLWVGGAERWVEAQRHDTGIWSVSGDETWVGAEYLWCVRVFVPALDSVVENLVTDPYSVGLTVDSKRSVIVDLDDPQWKPAGWGNTRPPALRSQAQQTIYELHVRDFSAWDQTVPEALRGTYSAFTLEDSHGIRALRDLADAGLTTLHLLPTYDIATTSIPELRSEQQVPSINDVELVPSNIEQLRRLPGWGPSSTIQQAAVEEVAGKNAFNWGYDPLHWMTPEGSYASPGKQDGGPRTLEYREMVAAIHEIGLRVVQDVVFNHTSGAGQEDMSILDKIVPGYYHRMCRSGKIENSTCCYNIATERLMAEKIMIDSLISAAVDYHVDGFRFDLMGHHSIENMLNVRAALDKLTMENSGVDGKSIYLYGEGWNFGEVENDALFRQATQAHVGGTGIGAFNDRMRDAVLGGTPADEDPRESQGFITGQYTDTNEVVSEAQSPDFELADLKNNMNIIRVSLAGSLRDFPIPTENGAVAASQILYGQSPSAFALNPEESVNYVEAHDNETLFDVGVWKLPTTTSLEHRMRAQLLANALVALGQSPSFWAAGTELLRSKSLDRDSYDSADWFNTIDWTGQWNQFGTGLPVANVNKSKWELMSPLLEDKGIEPTPEIMQSARQISLELLRIRASTPLFTLGNPEAIKQAVTFPNAGDKEAPGVIVMAIDGAKIPEHLSLARVLASESIGAVVVVFNASPKEWADRIDGLEGRSFELHPVQSHGADEIVKQSVWDSAEGAVSVPARTAAVFVDYVRS